MNLYRISLGEKRAGNSALVFCFQLCYGVLSGHNPHWQDLWSHDFMNIVETIRYRKKIAQIK
jgi:hypothetical protein